MKNLVYILLLSFSFSQDYSLSFDGVDDYVFIGAPEVLEFQSNNFTIVITAIVIPNAKEIIITNPRILAILLRKCGTSKFLISRDLILWKIYPDRRKIANSTNVYLSSLIIFVYSYRHIKTVY